MPADFDGSDLTDAGGEHIGTVERTYVDDAGNARFIKVKVGHLLGKHRLVPADQVEQQENAIQVPYTRDTIVESPHIDAGDTLEGESLDQVRTYYASDLAGVADEGNTVAENGEMRQESEERARTVPVAEVDTEETPANLGVVRDLGDVVEVPIIEEVLVKKQVVREVLRVKKSHTVEQGTAAADLRREDVEVVPSGQNLVRGESTSETDNEPL